jgi:hypothetical protein
MTLNITITKVDADDFGDTQWQYFAEAKRNGSQIWSDYYRTKPTHTKALNDAREAIAESI